MSIVRNLLVFSLLSFFFEPGELEPTELTHRAAEIFHRRRAAVTRPAELGNPGLEHPELDHPQLELRKLELRQIKLQKLEHEARASGARSAELEPDRLS